MRRLGLEAADLFVIAIGGALGATVRWLLTNRPGSRLTGAYSYFTDAFVPVDSFPTRTLLVNVIGCLVLGVLTVLLLRAVGGRRRVLLGAATGFCGSLTTFATFTVEAANLLGPGGDAAIGAAIAYVTISLASGGIAFAVGRTATMRAIA